jgi:hypothetical protein
MRVAFFCVLIAACGGPTTFGSDGGADASNDATVDASGDAAASDASDSGPTFGDAKVPDAATCTTLNIGILGNPGSDTSANFQSWLIAAGTSVTRIETQSTDPPITSGTIAGFDVVILDWLARDYTTSEAAAIQARIAGGGGLISMSGYNGTTSTDFRANTLLAPLSVAYSGSLLNGPVTNFATHPITQGLTSVTFNGGYAVSDLGGGSSTRTPIAFIGSTAVGYAIQLGSGRAFVWGDEWIEFDSEWTTLPQIKQLWVNIFAWVAPQGCPLQPQ